MPQYYMSLEQVRYEMKKPLGPKATARAVEFQRYYLQLDPEDKESICVYVHRFLRRLNFHRNRSAGIGVMGAMELLGALFLAETECPGFLERERLATRQRSEFENFDNDFRTPSLS